MKIQSDLLENQDLSLSDEDIVWTVFNIFKKESVQEKNTDIQRKIKNLGSLMIDSFLNQDYDYSFSQICLECTSDYFKTIQQTRSEFNLYVYEIPQTQGNNIWRRAPIISNTTELQKTWGKFISDQFPDVKLNDWTYCRGYYALTPRKIHASPKQNGFGEKFDPMSHHEIFALKKSISQQKDLLTKCIPEELKKQSS